MSLSSTLAEIATMSPEDRLRLVQAIWDGLVDEQAPIALSEAQRGDLQRRCAELDASPDNVLTWDQIKAYIKRER
jgi:putative addiction module component (TIGR02574 family)